MSDDLHHLAAAYALDALDPDERRAFESHYPSCAICSQEVDDFRATAAALADDSTSAPPAQLRARVLGEIAHTRQLAPDVTSIDGGSKSRRWVAPLLATAAAIVLMVGALGVFRWRESGDDVDAVIAARDAVVTTLEGEAGSIQVVWSAERDQVVILGNDIASAGDGMEYALWFVLEDRVAPAGSFDADDRIVRVALDVEDLEPNGWGVSIEPDGGSPQPTGDVIFLGTF